MSIIDTVSDVNNTFLSRRELTCNFAGLGGKLKKMDAIKMVSKEFNLDGKTVIPINMTSHVGKPLMTGTFYVYDDEKLARRQVSPVIFARLDKTRKKEEDVAAASEASDAAPDTEEAGATADQEQAPAAEGEKGEGK